MNRNYDKWVELKYLIENDFISDSVNGFLELLKQEKKVNLKEVKKELSALRFIDKYDYMVNYCEQMINN